MKHIKVSFPNLDGLRFFCFLGVFFYHSFATTYPSVAESKLYGFIKKILFHNGNLGVNFFFVLSGFLITYLLLSEKKSYGTIKVGNFYVRRILRIWPLFFFCVLFGFYLFPFIKSYMGEVPNETADISYYLVFLNNFDFINKGIPDSSVLGVLWSVAIEEQFYLLWPLFLTIIPFKYYRYFFTLIIIGSFIFRYIHANEPRILELHTISCISDMTVGGLLAVVTFQEERFKQKINTMPLVVWVLLYLLTAIIILFRQHIFTGNSLFLAADRLIISILFGFIILEQNFAGKSFYKMSNFKTVTKLGIYTYGLYCLHMIAILITAKGLSYLGWNRNVYQVIFLEGSVSLVIAVGIALFSYHFYEKPFLKLKGRFSRVTRF